MMCLSVGPHNARPVEGENHVKVLHADIVYDLIDATLQERGIHRDHRDHPAQGHACRECHRMFLGNAYVEEPVGV